MIKNYIKIAWRNLLKNKAFSSINIIGLAIGMAGALLIALWLQNMLSMDRFHEKSDRLYAISNRDEHTGKKWAWLNTPKIMGPTLKNDFPEIESFTRFDDGIGNQFIATYKDQKIVSQIGFADPGFFNMFSFPLLKGDKNNLLNDANSIVITQKYAKTLFGNEDPIGKIIKIDSVNLVTVTGLLQDLPNNSSMNFEGLVSWDYAKKIGYVDTNWSNNSTYTYLLLKAGTSLQAFNEKIRLVSQNHINVGDNEIKSTNEIFAFPFKDSYLYDKGEGGNYTSGRIQLVRLFAWIGAFILLVACINFMNLSTARSERRAKEVGVRKVVGAGRKSLMLQFISESILISLLAMVLAIIFMVLVLPAFNNLVQKNLTLSLLSVQTWLSLIAFSVITGIMAGSYPAFFLSSFKPLKTLKGKLNTYNKGMSIRSMLVIIQFSLAIILTIATIIVSKQIQFTKERERGYDENGLVYTSLSGKLSKNYISLRNELLNSNAVLSVSKNMSPVTDRFSNGWGFSWPGSTESDKKILFNRFSSDANAVQNLGFKLVKGRDIDVYKYATDSTAVLLTETAIKSMRISDPLGQIIQGDGENWTVVGVIKDFIIDSPYDEIAPMIILGPKSWFTTIHYRLNPNNSTETNLKKIADIFKKFNPDYPFDYKFIDKNFESKFKETQSIGTISMLFAGLTIFISCLGLLALIAYMAETRMKEIAVRKVLGASIGQLTSLLSLDFLKLVLIAILIASPIAWWTMNDWLKDYSYRIEIQWHYFAIAGLMAILISLATISYQAIKAALSNPVNSLRDE
jgi:ABC-type antimicrobial peptide transport system permease subunit